MFRLLIITLLAAWPSLSNAACTGQNLIEQMSPDERNALRAEAEAQPYGEGLLWRATKGPREITLFGSLHLPHDQTEAHLDRLLPLARTAEVTYFEMNASDTRRFESESRTRQDLMFIGVDQPTLPSLLSAAEWDALKAKLSARGFPPFIAAKMKPFMVSIMLGISPCKMSEMQTGRLGIDRALAEAVEAEKLPSRSIEDYRTIAKLLDYFSPEEQIEMLRLSLSFEQSPDDLIQTLFEAYIAEDVALIWEYNKKLSLDAGGQAAAEDFETFEKLLLTDRNNAWMEELFSASEKKLLVVVGAAHLGGAHGVLKQLETAGYTLTRLEL